MKDKIKICYCTNEIILSSHNILVKHIDDIIRSCTLLKVVMSRAVYNYYNQNHIKNSTLRANEGLKGIYRRQRYA